MTRTRDGAVRFVALIDTANNLVVRPFVSGSLRAVRSTSAAGFRQIAGKGPARCSIPRGPSVVVGSELSYPLAVMVLRDQRSSERQ